MSVIPDAFGNSGTDAAGAEAGGHGCGCVRTRRKPIGPNNEVTGGQYESTYSEMMWALPGRNETAGYSVCKLV